MKITFTLFAFFVAQILIAQNVGIKTTTPQAALDINGDLALRKGTLTLAAGPHNNLDISTSKYSVYDFAGGALSGGVQIYGFAGGTDGRIITIFNNSTTSGVQIADESHPGSINSLAANRIITGSGNSAIIYQSGSVTLRYDGQKQRWTIIGSNYTDGLSAAPAAWLVGGNAGTNPATNFIGTTDNKPLQFRINNQLAGKIEKRNISLGLFAASNNTTGEGNIALGQAALYNNTTRTSLVAIGDSALFNNGLGVVNAIDASYNTAVGSKTLFSNRTGNGNTANGANTLYSNTTGNYNTANGINALFYNTIGNYNTANGVDALLFNTTGSHNTANGRLALFSNSTGSENTATGEGAMFRNTTGSYNTAYGVDALFSNNLSDENTALGYKSLYNNTSIKNTATGFKSLYSNTTGYFNVASGSESLYNNIEGSNNVAIGHNALYNNLSGSYNTATGDEALIFNTSGSYNTALGIGALAQNSTGLYNISIGHRSGTTSSFNNTISIGNNGWLNAFHNQAFIGNSSTIYIGGWVGWSIYSDGRMKKNIQEDVQGLAFIKRLRPVTYNRDIEIATTLTGNKSVAEYPQKYDAEKIKTSGFIAQEVEQAAIACGYDFDGVQKPHDEKSLYSLTYASFVVPLVKAVQEISAQNEEMKKEIQELKAQNKILLEMLKNKN